MNPMAVSRVSYSLQGRAYSPHLDVIVAVYVIDVTVLLIFMQFDVCDNKVVIG